jgi:hypothetical protein
MGLDATVFRNIKSLEAEFGTGLFEVAEETCEVSPIDGAPDYDRLDDACVALHLRIGNIAAVGYLSEEIEKHLETGRSVILDKVLYSGSHCGDWIGPEFFPQLKAELAILIRVENPEILYFVGQMAQLVGMAELVGNPITF